MLIFLGVRSDVQLRVFVLLVECSLEIRMYLPGGLREGSEEKNGAEGHPFVFLTNNEGSSRNEDAVSECGQ